MITDYLIEKSNGLLTLSPENTDVLYSKFDDGGVEAEVGEFLYGLVRILKPGRILETGTYSGISSMYMAQALKENTYGYVITLEISEEHKNRAEKLWKTIELDRVQCKLVKSLDYEVVNFEPELIFLDSEPEIRFKELVKFYPKLTPGGYIFIHDLPPTFCKGNVNPDHPDFKDWPFGPVPEEMKNWIREDKLRPFSFPTPRGLVGFYKTKGDDYRA